MSRNHSARWFNVALGAWLCVSVLAWKHSPAQYNNGWIVGVATATVAALAMRIQVVRFINSLIAIWLFISAWSLPGPSDLTFWNSLLVSMAIYVATMLSNAPARLPGRPLHSGRTYHT